MKIRFALFSTRVSEYKMPLLVEGRGSWGEPGKLRFIKRKSPAPIAGQPKCVANVIAARVSWVES